MTFVAIDARLTIAATEEEGIGASLLLHIGKGQATMKLYLKVFDADVSHGIAFNASDETGIAAVGIGHADAANADVVGAGTVEPIGGTHAVA